MDIKKKEVNEFSTLTIQQYVLLTIFLSAVTSIFVVVLSVYVLREHVVSDETIINRTINNIVERIVEKPGEASDGGLVDRDEILAVLQEVSDDSQSVLRDGGGSGADSSSSLSTLPGKALMSIVDNARLARSSVQNNFGKTIEGVALENGFLATDVTTFGTVMTELFNTQEGEKKIVYQKKDIHSPYSFFEYSEGVRKPASHTLSIAKKEDIMLGDTAIAIGFVDGVEQVIKGYVSRISPLGSEGIAYATVVFEIGKFPTPSTPVFTDRGTLIGMYATRPKDIIVLLDRDE